MPHTVRIAPPKAAVVPQVAALVTEVTTVMAHLMAFFTHLAPVMAQLAAVRVHLAGVMMQVVAQLMPIMPELTPVAPHFVPIVTELVAVSPHFITVVACIAVLLCRGRRSDRDQRQCGQATGGAHGYNGPPGRCTEFLHKYLPPYYHLSFSTDKLMLLALSRTTDGKAAMVCKLKAKTMSIGYDIVSTNDDACHELFTENGQ
jgi:hypothetical protein